MFDRRTLMQLSAAAIAAGCAPWSASNAKLRVVIVGAGIIGASIAYNLSKLGTQVTVIDAVGPATQTTRGTFAWINATWAKQPRHYHALSQDGVASWKSLQTELDIPVKWGGSIEWFEAEARQDKLAQQIAEQIEWGEPAAMIGPDKLSELEPKVDFQGATRAAYSGTDGAVDPVLATQILLDAAKALGASIRFPCALEGIVENTEGITGVETSTGRIVADKVILATGAEQNITETFAGIALPQRTTPGVIAITKPMPTLLNRLVIAPGVHMHQRLDGRVVLGEQAGAPDTQAHAMRLAGRPITFPNQDFADQHFEQIRTIAESYVPDMAKAEVEEVHIGWRPLPVDGHPVLGRSPKRPDCYIAIMHSGVSLAPIVGQLVARDIVSETSIEQLANYRPDRDFETVRRY